MSAIKGRLVQRGEHLLEYDGEDADAIYDALADAEPGTVPSGLYDVTETDRSDVDPDEWLELSEDDGTLLWAGWLGGVDDEPPGADRDALEQLAARRNHYRDALEEIRDNQSKYGDYAREVASEALDGDTEPAGRQVLADLAASWAEPAPPGMNLTHDEIVEQHIYQECARSLLAAIGAKP